MYNQKIIDRLNNLTYLKALKNSNATAITKKNLYGDIVKFYAQINKNDVIQAITFKCTGCSYFTALCSYFCELAEGKTVAEALKIKEKDLVAFAKLDESRHHIYPLILGTFALLVKKYRKAIELGKVEPCEVIDGLKTVEKKSVSKKKTIDSSSGLKDILVTNSTSVSRQRKSTTVTTKVTKTISQESLVSKAETISTSNRKTEKEDRISRAKAIARAVEMEVKSNENADKKATSKTAKADKKHVTSKEKPVKESKKEKVEVAKIEAKPKKEKEPKKQVEKTELERSNKAKKTTTTKVTKNIEVIKEEKTKKVASKGGLFGRKQKIEDTKTSNVIVDENIGKRKKSVDLAIINEAHDEHYLESEKHDEVVVVDAGKGATQDGEVVVSNAIPTDTQDTTQVIVQTVEQKRRVQTTVVNGEKTVVSGEKINAMKLSAEGENVHSQIHSATNLSDMISRLNSSKSKINSVEAHSVTRVEKSVNGKTIDSASTLTSFSSMRDNLHKMRESNVGVATEQKKALPEAKKERKDDDVFVERMPKSKDIAKEVREKEERGTKRGLFSRLFKK